MIGQIATDQKFDFQEALSAAFLWARQLGVEISEMDERTIMASRRNFLWYKNQPWKKKVNPEFDSTMGSFDGAEVCDLIGLYILHIITSSGLGIRKEELGLYRDDGLGIMRRSKRELDNIRKGFHKLLDPLGFKITMETGMKTTDFLDVTLHLGSGTFEPYRKDEEKPMYINKKSNHPRTIGRTFVSTPHCHIHFHMWFCMKIRWEQKKIEKKFRLDTSTGR